jgi:hemerythrin-like domain-containing protein
MSSPLALHNAPAAGFDEPFEMLHACHGRVHGMLGLLHRLERHLQAQGDDDQGRQAARDIMRYFDLAAVAHHEDEERHVFPALLSVTAPVAAAAQRAVLVRRLRREHRVMAGRWQALRRDLVTVAEGRWRMGVPPQAARRWARFAALYARHIEREETEAFPVAQRELDAAATEVMGREMAARRGVRLAPPAGRPRAGRPPQ